MATRTSQGLDAARLRRLIEVGRSLVSEMDLEVVLGRVLDAARELTGCRYAALGVLDDDRRELERFVFAGLHDDARSTIGALPKGHGLLGEVIREPRPLRVAEVGAHPRSYGFPPGHPPMHNFLGVPILVRGKAWGNLYLTEKIGDFESRDEETAVVLAEWAAIAIDNARLYQSAESRRLALEHTVSALEASTAIGLAIGTEADLDGILELVVKRGRALVEARSLVLLVAEEGSLVVATCAGEVSPEILGQRMQVGDSILGDVFRTGRAERLTSTDSRLQQSLGEMGLQATAGLFVPLDFRGRVLGVMYAVDRMAGSPEFSPEDERMLVAFATSAGTAIAAAQSVAQDRLRESISGAERERARWARELHDQTLQGLGGLRVVLSSARSRGAASELDRAVGQAVEQVGHEIDALRGLIADLRPASLDDLGPEAALGDLAKRVSSMHHVRVDVSIDLAWEAGRSATRLAPDLENALYRVAQEAMTNVVKHAGATRMEMRLEEQDGKVELAVQDDGTGFDADATHVGLGLRGMRERVEMEHGIFSVSSSPQGTSIRASLLARHVAAGPGDAPGATG